MCIFYSVIYQDWFTVKLDQSWVHRHEKWVATGGDYMEKMNWTVDIDVKVTSV